MFNLIPLFLIKIIDNLISTAKSIAVMKSKEILSSVLVIVSQIIFYLVVKKVMQDSTLVAVILISIASGIGNWIAIKINNKYKKDAIWTNVVTCSDKESITKLCDMCVQNKIKCIVTPAYARDWEETYSVIIFSNTKTQSKMIDKFLDNESTKYLRRIIK